MSPDLMLAVSPSPARPVAERSDLAAASEAPPTRPVAPGALRGTPFGDLLARLAGRGGSAARPGEDPPRASGERRPEDADAAPAAAAVFVPQAVFPTLNAGAPTVAVEGDAYRREVSCEGPPATGTDAGPTPAAPAVEAWGSAVLLLPHAPAPGTAAGWNDALPDPVDHTEARRATTPASASGLPATGAGIDQVALQPGAVEADATTLLFQASVLASAELASAEDEGGESASPVNDGSTRGVRPETRTNVRALAADTATLVEAAAAPRSVDVAEGARAAEGTWRSGPVAAQLVEELSRLLAKDPTSDEGLSARASTPAVEAVESDDVAAPSTRPAVERRAMASRGLAAYLLRSPGESPQTRTWRVAAAAVSASEESARQTNPASAAPTRPADGQAELTTAGLAMPGTSVSVDRGPAGTAPTVAPAAGPADEHAVVQQIVKAIRMQWKQGLGEARIRIEPEHLGTVHISLRVQAGAVTAVVKAENPTVQAWIETRQQELRSALDEQGLRLQRFEVLVDPEGRRQSRETPQESPIRRAKRGSATETAFEIEIQAADAPTRGPVSASRPRVRPAGS